MSEHPWFNGTTDTPAASRTEPGVRGFAILQNRGFRWLLMAKIGDAFSSWVEQVARSWLVWEITGSPFLLALISLTRAIPMLAMSLMAGVLADRFNKKTILLVASSASFTFKLATALIITTGVMQLWHVFLLGVLLGISNAFNQPVKNALIPSLVGKKNLVGAMSLSEGGTNITRVVAPGIAASLMVFIGIDGIYYLSSAIYLLVLAFISLIRMPSFEPIVRRQAALADLKEGLRFSLGYRPVLTLLLLSISPTVFSMPFMTILPVFSDQVLHAGVAGFGWMLSARSLGMVTSSLFMASRVEFRRQGLALWLCTMGHSAILVAFSLSTLLPLSIALMAAMGLTDAPYKVLSRTLLLYLSPPDMEGRIMGVYSLDRGLSHLGTAGGGGLAEVIGAPLALGILGFLSLSTSFGLGLWEPRVRKL